MLSTAKELYKKAVDQGLIEAGAELSKIQ